MSIGKLHCYSYFEALELSNTPPTVKNPSDINRETFHKSIVEFVFSSIHIPIQFLKLNAVECMHPDLPDDFIEEVKAIRKAHARGNIDWKIDLEMLVEKQIGRLPDAYEESFRSGSSAAPVCLLVIYYLELLCKSLGLKLGFWPCTEQGWVQTIMNWVKNYVSSISEEMDAKPFAFFIVDLEQSYMLKRASASTASLPETEAPETPQESYLVSAEEWVDLYGKEIKHKIKDNEELLIAHVNKMRSWYEEEKAKAAKKNNQRWKTQFLRDKICGTKVSWLANHYSITHEMINDLFGKGVFTKDQVSRAKKKLKATNNANTTRT